MKRMEEARFWMAEEFSAPACRTVLVGLVKESNHVFL